MYNNEGYMPYTPFGGSSDFGSGVQQGSAFSHPVLSDSNTNIDITDVDFIKGTVKSYKYAVRSRVMPLSTTGQVIVGIDPSKTGMGISIEAMNGQYLRLFEISGKGSKRTTGDFCGLVTKFLSELLSPEQVALFGQEQVILPRDGYNAMVILNEIRTNLKNFCMVHLRKECLEINNSVWKAAILPQQYRKKSVYKGSYLWITSKFPMWGFLTDNMTDAMCISYYIKMTYVNSVPVYCSASEYDPKSPPYILIVGHDAVTSLTAEHFTFNPEYSLEDNAAFYNNRRSVAGFCALPEMNPLSLYKYRCSLSRYSRLGELYMFTDQRRPQV